MNEVYYQRDYSERLRVGLVGIGHHAYRTLLATLHYLPVELVAIAYKSNEKRATDTAREFGCRLYSSTEEMYAQEKLDAVFLCVSPQLHPLLIEEAFRAGVHVWVEKPPSMRAEDIERLIDRRGDRYVVVGFKKAFMPVVDKAKEIVESGDYGNLRTMLAVYPMTIPSAGEEVLDRREFTNWLGNGVHPLSFLIAIGGNVQSIIANTSESGHGVCILFFENGVIGNFHLASGPHPIESYSLFGDSWHCRITDNRRLELHRSYGPTDTSSFLPAGFDTGTTVWEAQNCLATIENYSIFTQGIYSEMRYFCDCVLEGREPQRGNLEFALQVMRVYEAGLVSHGRLVNL